MNQPIETVPTVPGEQSGSPVRANGWFPPLRHVNPPNLVTSASVALGFGGILLMSHGRPELAMLCALLTLPCDLLDGLLARKLGLQSSFGAALDSLADAISFCLLPAVLAHGLGMRHPLHLLLLFAYVLAGIWRLAHFEQAGLVQWRGRPAFQGVPTPYAASLVFLIACAVLRWPGALTEMVLACGMGLLALGMVSSLPFPKGGWHYHVMWALLPIGLLLAWLA